MGENEEGKVTETENAERSNSGVRRRVRGNPRAERLRGLPYRLSRCDGSDCDGNHRGHCAKRSSCGLGVHRSLAFRSERRKELMRPWERGGEETLAERETSP